MKKDVLIIGGGFAGLAAGVELVSQGHSVTLIEKKGHLGGRAYSYRDPVTGSVIDNGQHILMGCYRDTLSFLEKIGTLDRVHFQKNLEVDFAGPGIDPVRFKAWSVPNPWHLLGGFLSFKGLGWRDRLSVLKMKRLGDSGFLNNLDEKSVPDWLGEMGQSNLVQERFWNPLNFAALNDRPEVSSAALFHAVLKEALFSGKAGARIGLPKVGLSDLYTEAARDFIERKGGQFLLKTSVQRLHFRDGEFYEVELEGGRRISAEALLLTVPFTMLRKILPDWMLYEDPFFHPMMQLTTSPIVSIHLWFDREPLDKTFVGLWGTKVHWIFNKSRLFHDGPGYLSLVISGAREELSTSSNALVEMALKELCATFPEIAKLKVVRSMVTKEPEATMAPVKGVSRLRLPQKTPYKNLFLAGDWTDTGLPATIESAVRSAKRAVQLIEASENSGD